MYKLNAIQQYRLVEEGASVHFVESDFHVGQARRITMRVNAPKPTNIYVTRIDDDDPQTGEVFYEMVETDGKKEKVYTDIRLLASVPAGLTPIEFYYKGSFSLTALDSEIWLETLEGGDAEIQPTDFSSYARVWEREEEDPRILEIKREARRNQQRLLEEMARDRAERAQLLNAIYEMKAGQNVVSTSNTAGSADQGPTAGGPTVGAPVGDTSVAPTSAGTGGSSDDGA